MHIMPSLLSAEKKYTPPFETLINLMNNFPKAAVFVVKSNQENLCTKLRYLYLCCQVFGRLHHEVKTLHHLGWFEAYSEKQEETLLCAALRPRLITPQLVLTY